MAEHVCPVWVGYILISPLRKLWHNPRKILAPYVKPGMCVLDIGCAMGFFSLPMAEMSGSGGKVICMDLQEKMLHKLMHRAKRANLDARIEVRKSGTDNLGIDDLSGVIDFALAFSVVHELPDPKVFFTEVHNALKPGGKLLLTEPKGRVTESAFEHTLSLAEEKGFMRNRDVKVWSSHAMLLSRPN